MIACHECDGAGEVVVSASCAHGYGQCPECGVIEVPCLSCDEGYALCEVKGCRNRAVDEVDDELLCQHHAMKANAARVA